MTKRALERGLHELPEGMGIGTIHSGLGKERKLGAMCFRGKLFDLLIGTRFLAPKLVAREAQDGESSRGVFFIHGLQLLVVDVGLASLGRYIDH